MALLTNETISVWSLKMVPASTGTVVGDSAAIRPVPMMSSSSTRCVLILQTIMIKPATANMIG